MSLEEDRGPASPWMEACSPHCRSGFSGLRGPWPAVPACSVCLSSLLLPVNALCDHVFSFLGFSMVSTCHLQSFSSLIRGTVEYSIISDTITLYNTMLHHCTTQHHTIQHYTVPHHKILHNTMPYFMTCYTIYHCREHSHTTLRNTAKHHNTHTAKHCITIF